MGRGRRRAAIPALMGAVAVAAALGGCGPESHANDPRPATPAEITVNITDTQVQVQPDSAGTKAKQPATLDQNAGVKNPQADSGASLLVNFTILNGTTVPTALEIRGTALGKKNPSSSPEITAQGTGLYKLFLPTGRYTITAADIPAAKAAPFTIGPFRTSAQNDLLLP